MVKPLLSIRGLVKRFGGLTATDHTALDLYPGEIHALIGPNGAGKTTLVHQLSGTLAPDAGEIWFAGQDITHQDMSSRVRNGLVRSFQITSIFKRLSVLDNVALAVPTPAHGGARVWWRRARLDTERFAAAATLVERMELGTKKHLLAGALSHGEQRQLEVAMALATTPRLMLLDEPMAGMGPQESARMVQLLAGLRPATSMLLIEHDMDAVFQLADRVSVLVGGRIIASGPPEVIRQHPEVQQAYLGGHHHAPATTQQELL